MGAFYCAICRQTTFSGKGHIFGKSHQNRLRVVLLKFLEKVKEARRTIKKPQVEKFDCIQHEQMFWCYCCELEIQRNVTDGNITVLHGGLLEHMATPQHKKNTHKFWWDNKADPKLKDKVIITEEEAERFKTEVANVLETFVEKQDEFIKQQADCIRAQEKHRQEVLQSHIEVCFPRMQWHVTQSQSCLMDPTAQVSLQRMLSGNSAFASDILSFFCNINKSTGNYIWPFWHSSCSLWNSSHFRHQGPDQHAGSSFDDEVMWDGSGQGLTFIGYQDSSNSGNVHTGAVPPWLQDDPLEGSSGAAVRPEIGPSVQEFLKHKEQEKLRKLPPNRVGANFDHSSHTDANWLPSFGRVWNSGRRWQSRHQFRQEEGQKNRQKRKRDHSTEESKKMKTSK